MTLREVLESGKWFRRKSWDGTFEPFAFRWMQYQGRSFLAAVARLEKAPLADLSDNKISERRFSAFDVLATDWELVK